MKNFTLNGILPYDKFISFSALMADFNVEPYHRVVMDNLIEFEFGKNGSLIERISNKNISLHMREIYLKYEDEITNDVLLLERFLHLYHHLILYNKRAMFLDLPTGV